jgi:hypothetical protein
MERTGGACDARWMCDCVLGAVAAAAASGDSVDVAAAPQSTRPRQDPAFPAAFVFQTHSALYLAAALPASRAGRSGPG